MKLRVNTERVACLVCAALLSLAQARADLSSYVSKPEPAYTWEQKSFQEGPGGSVQELSMVSQTWEGMEWKHRIQVFRPLKPAHPDVCLLYNTGGSGGVGDTMLGTAVSQATGCPVAVLYNIPNQPLWGKTEDALIVYTWQKYVETGDENWPLQFPMVKSVLKAMDAVQASAKPAGQPAVTGFIIAGASKRGWTAWLTGATADKRIRGIVPMVIDILNMPAQIPHQIEMYGATSDMIRDYRDGGVLNLIDKPVGRKLISMVDPYAFRAKLTMPKLLVLGTNDPYWSQDALNLYWDGLLGPKWVLYTPNSGHGLEDQGRVLASVAAFTRSVAAGTPLPKLTWKWTEAPKGAKLTLRSDQPLRSARLFRAESSTTDFRKSKWSSTEIAVQPNGAAATAEAPATGYAATFVEATFDRDGKPFTLSTQMRILGKPAPR